MDAQKDAPHKKVSSAIWRMVMACVITALAFLLSSMMLSPLLASTSAFFSVPERNDFTITDFYNLVADSRAVSRLDDNIVIVNIDESDRNEIADIISVATLAGAKAVLLDVMFDEPREGDEPLLKAISECPVIIQPMALNKKAESVDTFTVAATSFFYQSGIDSTTIYAAASMPSKFHKSVVREMQTYFPMETGERIPSMAAAVAHAVDPRAARALDERDNEIETINFHSRRFRVIQPDELIDKADLLRDRIVMVGALNEPSDLHPTPVSISMSGVMIHAHSLATILDQAYMTPIPRGYNIVIAFVLCLIIVSVNLFLISGVKGLLLRILQVLFVWLSVQLGYWLFVSHNVVVDFSYALLMLTFGLFACDVWNGMVEIGKWLIGRIKPLFNKTSTN